MHSTHANNIKEYGSKPLTLGIHEISNEIKSRPYNYFDTMKEELFKTDVGNLILSGAWILPMTILAFGLLLREHLCKFFGDKNQFARELHGTFSIARHK